MFWADQLLQKREGSEVINDSFTPSGIVHMGSLKGPVIHDTLFRILKSQKKEVKFMYGFDDFDPIDGLPSDLMKTHQKYLGIPISIAPAPTGNGTFGDYFSNKMLALLNGLGIKPTEVYKTSVLYKNGTFDNAIRFVLDHAQEVRNVYSEIYKKEIPATWYPLQIVCPNCGKVGTTKVTSWDKKEVSFSCEENLVKWAVGCKTQGKISPFGGNAKMPWKVEWAAKWWTFGVTIEGAGKDHASAGGSYDVAMKLCSDVFKAKTPLKIAYEFFLSGGKKMSSSKGLGLTGEDLLEALPPELVRFLMIKTPPNQAVEFTPKETDLIPKLYDDYLKTAHASDADFSRAFTLSKINQNSEIPTTRFQTLTQWVQMPNMGEEIKKQHLQEWVKYAKVWVEKYAPESEKFTVQKEIPKQTQRLTDHQRHYLKLVAERFDKSSNEIELSANLYKWIEELMLKSIEAFAAIYLALIGKDHGPKAASLIRSLDKEFVKKRFEEVAEMNHESGGADQASKTKIVPLHNPEIFSIAKEVKEKFPSVSVGIAIIKGVSIQKSNPDLEKEKVKLLDSFQDLTTEQISLFNEITSYRKLYKQMGIDWHSRRPSPEALLRRVALKKGLYTINTCVDAYNLVVMKNRVSIGAFDLDTIVFQTTLRYATEVEDILLLGDEEATKYKNTELAYFDKKSGYNIDFNYRDSQRTAVQLTTKNLYINVDGIYDISSQMVEQSLKEACDSIIHYCGGVLESFGVESA